MKRKNVIDECLDIEKYLTKDKYIGAPKIKRMLIDDGYTKSEYTITKALMYLEQLGHVEKLIDIQEGIGIKISWKKK